MPEKEGVNIMSDIDLFHSCALEAFIDALPMDDGHRERSRILAYKYFEEEKKILTGIPESVTG